MSAPSYANLVDQTLLGTIQDRTLEPNNSGASMLTAQFGTTPADSLTNVINALNQAQQDFVRDSGLVVCHVGFRGDASVSPIGVAANQEFVPLPQDLMDTRRRAWISYDGQGGIAGVQELPEQDSWTTDSFDPNWEVNFGTPLTADESLPAIPALALASPPQASGGLDLLYMPVATALSNSGIALSVPPEFAPYIVWRALWILLTSQTEAQDAQRARYAHMRYQEGVILAKSLLYMGNQVPVREK